VQRKALQDDPDAGSQKKIWGKLSILILCRSVNRKDEKHPINPKPIVQRGHAQGKEAQDKYHV
jgi:hypothetical protein